MTDTTTRTGKVAKRRRRTYRNTKTLGA
jgi:hypothetical protein